jgi:hypothetical protein
VYNNIAYDNEIRGLTVGNWGEPGVLEHPMDNVKIINNTFYGNGQGVWGGGIHIENPDARNLVVRNNIVSQNLSFQIGLEGVSPESVTVDHNLIDGFRGYVGEIFGSDSVVGDPLFADTSSADFRLLTGSQAIDRGSPVDAPSEDFDGTPRPQGAGYDIGAFEYSPIGVAEDRHHPPTPEALIANHPNPFRVRTVIYYHHDLNEPTYLAIFDLSGRLVRTLPTEPAGPVRNAVTWDGTDRQGRRLPPGVYFCRLTSERSPPTRMMVLLP